MILQLKDVGVRRSGTWLVSGVNWLVQPGEHWAVIGPNGAGKSTLLAVIQGYEWPTRGEVEVLGCRLGQVDLRQLRTRIGWVGQGLSEWFSQHHGSDPAVLVVAGGVTGQIGVGIHRPDKDAENLAGRTLDDMGLAYLRERPFRYLSQGERQRVLLARAWVSRPDLLILDEVTSGLDLGGREAVLDSINTLGQHARGPAFLFVTHHIEEVVTVFTHVALLKKGKVLAAGPKTDVLQSERVSEAFDVPVAVSWQSGRPWITVSGPGPRNLPGMTVDTSS